MNKLSVILTAFVLTITFLILPTAQAADIELNDTCSLEDAITAASTDETAGGCVAGDGADTITLSSNITLDAALPHITSEITIEGGGFTISGNNRYRIFVINGGTLTVNNLTMTKGSADWGGAIANLKGTLTITDSDIISNTASEGGSIGNDGTVTIIESDVSDNSANMGCAIHSLSGTILITESTISDNKVGEDGEGGAAYIESGRLSIIGSTVNNNKAEGNFGSYNKGGAISINSGHITIINSDFVGNLSMLNGGAVYTRKGAIRIENSRFIENAARNGGALFNDLSDDVRIITSTFKHNSAKRSGGAILTTWPFEINITKSTFTGNSAGTNGGAIHSVGEVQMYESTLNDNSAGTNGGAIYSDYEIQIRTSTINGNNATNKGGGLYVEKSASALEANSLTNVTLVHNSAENGGGIYKEGGSEVNMYNSIVASNGGGDCFGRLNENVNNLIGDGSCFPTLMGDPMLGELVLPDDGSPPYYPLLEGSPAIDAADDEYCPATDQIGTKRPQGAGCDIGAYELPTATDN